MDFFERQDRARRRTHLLVGYFALAVLFTVLAVYLVVALLFLHERASDRSLAWLWHPQLFAGVMLGTTFVIGLGTVIKMLELRRGGGAVAAMLGGKPVPPNTLDVDARKLRNVVEEMALASGTPVPEVYVLGNERGINAFAAGLGTGDAAVGVTDGCMRRLSRDELQGVVAHEFSHILNGDMRLNVQLMGFINGLFLLTVVGRQLLRVSTRSRYSLHARSGGGKGANPLPLLGLALIIIGFIGVFFGRLIKSAVSRQREFLADAAAVQFTRNPQGLAGALKKVGRLAAGSRLRSTHAEQASHMFFCNGLAESWLAWFSTHPPLAERIRALDPSFDGQFKAVEPEAELPSDIPPRLDRIAQAPTQAPVPQGIRPGPDFMISAAAIVPQLGEPTRRHLRYAEHFLASLPEPLAEAAREPLSAAALVLNMILSPVPELRARQLAALEARIPPAFYSEIPRLLPHVDQWERDLRLPLVNLALPALRRLSAVQFGHFESFLRELIESDAEVDLFEYMLQRMVRRHLAPLHHPEPPPAIEFYALRPLLPDCDVLLSALAHQAHAEPARASAFRAGTVQLGAEAAELALLPAEQCGLAEIDATLLRLGRGSPGLKRRVLMACAQTAASDGVIIRHEAELLRAMADALDCPIPPFLEGL